MVCFSWYMSLAALKLNQAFHTFALVLMLVFIKSMSGAKFVERNVYAFRELVQITKSIVSYLTSCFDLSSVTLQVQNSPQKRQLWNSAILPSASFFASRDKIFRLFTKLLFDLSYKTLIQFYLQISVFPEVPFCFLKSCCPD